MIAAEQRLRDAGYGEKFLLTQGDDDDSDLKIDDEIKVGRYNSTTGISDELPKFLRTTGSFFG